MSHHWYEAGHVAIVTGASRGLGRALARALLGHRVRVVVDARDTAALEDARADLARFGDVVAIAGDVADSAHAHALVDAAHSFGRLDLLVNNASTLGTVPLPPLAELAPDVLRTVFDVNVAAPLHLIRHALPLLRRADPGTIVNVTSDAAVEAYPGWGGYGASKAALEALSRVLALELHGSNVRVLVADPGEMDTRMHRDAVPDADPRDLRDPADSARFVLEAIATMDGAFARVVAPARTPA
ncbi:MAG TPA: SDR family oxidoreductase [Candidatus Elarobacter sp.]|jgi:NAD(P)-dependent dehydrogenase (short-subunit alcohol dehydrogenase family)|nr:SDR family oxidoreductase [Candidatus Elarobacter sp.]